MIFNRWFLILLYFFATSIAWSHESRPVFVKIQEQNPNQFQMQLKIPFSLPIASFPDVLLPNGCKASSQLIVQRQSDAFLKQQFFSCTEMLTQKILGIDYPGVNPSISTLVQIKLLSGEVFTHIFKPGEKHWQVPVNETFGAVAKEYLLLGIQHIWEGIDHLLFVACLIFIARTPRRIFLIITGFTLAHSLTLVLSTLKLFSLPVPPVEAAIALSIVFMAHEIVKPNMQSWTWRYPVLVASAFGLLHGFGFASVLREIGLPQTELPLALLMFNLGVEIGQMVFVVACVVIFLGASKLVSQSRFIFNYRRVSTTLAYVVGSLASFWLIDRVVVVISQ